MAIDKYLCLTPEQFEGLCTRYEIFQKTCDDVTKKPVKVFSPLPKKALDELYLNREVSKDLQKKKEEDMKKAAQLAEEMAAQQSKESEEKVEEAKVTEVTEGDEEKKPEPENSEK